MIVRIRFRSMLRCVITVAAMLAMTASAVAAQAVRASIQGTVVDATGAALPGATIEVRNTGTSVVQAVVANEQGRYTVPDLIVGEYEVQATLQGFRPVVQRGITLTVGSQRVVNFQLALGGVEESIVVESAAAQVDLVSGALGTRVEQKQISELPLNGRNINQLILLTPGVELATANPTARLGRQPGISVAGARPDGQAILIDNTNVQNFWNRGSGSGVLGTTLGVEAIKEFQTLTNTYSAQFGGSGAVINQVTKSGTNVFHGSVYEFVRNSRLDARNFFDVEKPPFSKNQFGASLGGPVLRDRAFFFANYEGVRQTLGQTRVVTVPDMNARQGLIPINGVLTNVGVHPAIRPILDQYPQPDTLIGGGLGQTRLTAESDGAEHYTLARLDYTLTDKDTLFGRVINDRGSLFEPFGGSSIPKWPSDNRTDNWYVTAEARRLVSAAIVNQVRFSFTRTHEDAQTVGSVPGLQVLPGVDDATITPGGGLTGIGSGVAIPTLLDQDRYTVADDLSMLRGSHSLRVGGHFERWVTPLNLPLRQASQWTFGGLQNLLTNRPLSVVGALPGSSAARIFRETHLMGYVHDDWTIGSSLTLNLGLRYEFITNPTVHTLRDGNEEETATTLIDGGRSVDFTPVTHVFKENPSTRNFDPRVGFAWTPFNDQKTAIRGGVGVFHSLLVPRTYATGYYLNPPFFNSRQDFPTFPDAFATTTPTLPSTANGLNYSMDETPHLMQWNLNVQRELVPATILTVGYVGSLGRDLLQYYDDNPVQPLQRADGSVVYGVPRGAVAGIVSNPRANARLAQINWLSTTAESEYHSLQMELNRRFYRNVQAQVTYTLAHCRDHSSAMSGLEGGAEQTNPYDADADWGPCLNTRTHSFRGSGIVALPFSGNAFVEGWQISGLVGLHTGIPFSPEVGFDQSGPVTVQQRPNWASGRDADNALPGAGGRYFDPAAFELPAPGTLGNVGRHVLTGPGRVDVDVAVIKDTAIRGVTLQLRVEVFNVLNRTNFGQPSTALFSAAPNGGGARNAAAGLITAAAPARQLQFAVKVLF
jgi:hypothetical protein